MPIIFILFFLPNILNNALALSITKLLLLVRTSSIDLTSTLALHGPILWIISNAAATMAVSVLSNELSKRGFEIALIDRAKNEKSLAINDFFCPYINKCPSFYTPVFSNQLGGNSALWHSKVYLLSKEEIETNKWYIKYNELENYSNQLAKEFEVNKSLITKSENHKHESIYRCSQRVKFKNLYEHLNIKKNKKITVFRGFSPIKLLFNKDKVEKVNIRNNQNKEPKNHHAPCYL